jgi:hypothetical protein
MCKVPFDIKRLCQLYEKLIHTDNVIVNSYGTTDYAETLRELYSLKSNCDTLRLRRSELAENYDNMMRECDCTASALDNMSDDYQNYLQIMCNLPTNRITRTHYLITNILHELDSDGEPPIAPGYVCELLEYLEIPVGDRKPDKLTRSSHM